MPQQPNHDPITTACIYYTTNRSAILAWAATKPTLGAATITDPAAWAEHLDYWVSRWKVLYKQGYRESWLCERYLVGPLGGIRTGVEKFLEERGSE